MRLLSTLLLLVGSHLVLCDPLVTTYNLIYDGIMIASTCHSDAMDVSLGIASNVIQSFHAIQNTMVDEITIQNEDCCCYEISGGGTRCTVDHVVLDDDMTMALHIVTHFQDTVV